MAVAISQTTRHSSLPVIGAFTMRTRLMRRSALVKVPSFSRNDVPGRNTWAKAAVSFRNRSCTTRHSMILERGVHVFGVGVRLGDVLALHEHALEGAFDGGAEHVGNAQARLGIERGLPYLLEHVAHRVVADMAIARIFMREGTHVAGALHIVLATERIDADAIAPDIAGAHGEIGHGHHHGRALAECSVTPRP